MNPREVQLGPGNFQPPRFGDEEPSAGAFTFGAAIAEHVKNMVTDEMVDRFLSWELPESVCVDGICTRVATPGEHRTGMNLMTHAEARQMLEHVLYPQVK